MNQRPKTIAREKPDPESVIAMTTTTDLKPAQLDQQSINTIRFLAVDAVQKANSGHPGLPLGTAPMAYVLWTRILAENVCKRAIALLEKNHA